jgi:hypothetical protein
MKIWQSWFAQATLARIGNGAQFDPRTKLARLTWWTPEWRSWSREGTYP